MKKVFSWGKWIFTGLALLALGFSFAAAEITPPSTACRLDLLAGKNRVAYGDLFVWNDATNLYVQFNVWGTNVIESSHVAVGCNLSAIPVNSQGTPVPGAFPLQNNIVSTIHTYVIPLASLSPCNLVGSQVFIGAHGVLYCASKDITETMWGYVPAVTNCGALAVSYPFPNTKRWSAYIVYTIH